jgi:hypothetical protein
VRKGKSGDITYYIRYSYTYRDEEGHETVKDVKEKLGQKSRGFTREIAKEALKARLGEIAQRRFNLDKVRKPHAFGELVDRYLKHAESYKASYQREKYSIEGLREISVLRLTYQILPPGRWRNGNENEQNGLSRQPSTVS